MEDPDNIESAWAGLLNGTMIILLGAAFPAALLWQLITHWPDFVSGSHEMTSMEAMQGIVLTGVSAQVLWFGIRMIARQVVWLSHKRR